MQKNWCLKHWPVWKYKLLDCPRLSQTVYYINDSHFCWWTYECLKNHLEPKNKKKGKQNSEQLLLKKVIKPEFLLYFSWNQYLNGLKRDLFRIIFVLRKRWKFPLAPMGVLATWSAHARPSARPPIDTSGNFSGHMSGGVGVKLSESFSYQLSRKIR